MKKLLFTLIATALVSIRLSAQPDVKVETGMVAFGQQDFAAAIKAFDIGLADPTLLKPKNVARAYYHRGMSRFLLTQQVVLEMGKKMQNKDTLGVKKMGEELFSNLRLVLLDYGKARETDTELKWTKEIESGSAIVRRLVTSMVDQGLTAIENQEIKNKIKPEDYIQVKSKMLPLIDAVIALNKDDYMGYDMRGQVDAMAKDTAAAITDYEMAIKKFREKPPVEPDMIFAYTYYRVANLYQGQRQFDKALTLLGDGKGVVDTELKRLEAKKEYYHDTIWAKFVDRHDKIQNALFTGELNILLQLPEKLNEALAKFEKAVADDPKNYNIHVAYASLLEKSDSAKAVSLYNKAIAIDPKKSIAYYNLGVFYNAKAKDFQDKANATEKADLSTAFQKLRDDNFMLAKPLFEKALETDPKSLSSVTALKQIATFLMLNDEFTKYNELEKKMKADMH